MSAQLLGWAVAVFIAGTLAAGVVAVMARRHRVERSLLVVAGATAVAAALIVSAVIAGDWGTPTTNVNPAAGHSARH